MINGYDGCVRLHVNQRWDCIENNKQYDIEYKFLSLTISSELFNKMFEEV